MDKRTDSPVHWVAAGGGVLAYGAGRHVDFALEGDPFTTVSHLSFDEVISEALILGKYALLSQEGLGLQDDRSQRAVKSPGSWILSSFRNGLPLGDLGESPVRGRSRSGHTDL